MVPLPVRFKPNRFVAAEGGVFAERRAGRRAPDRRKILGGHPTTFEGGIAIFTGAMSAVKAAVDFRNCAHGHENGSDEAQFRGKLDWVERLLLPMR